MAVSRKLRTDSLKLSINGQPTAPESDAVKLEGTFLNKEFEIEIRKQELQTLVSHNNTLAQNNEERKKYARRIFNLTCIWTLLIFVILFMVGMTKILLSDKVIIALITSTTINFFVFFTLVIRYLFNPGNAIDPAKKNTG